MSNNVTVDDEDPGIVYSLSSIAPQWTQLGGRTRHKGSNKGGIQGASDGTLTGTNEAGATAAFSFNGTGITVYGAYGPIPNNFTGVSTTTPPISNYTIDSGTPVSFSIDLFPTAAVFGQQFFATDALNGDVEHRLVITNVQDGGWLWIDDLVFTPYDASPSPTPNPSPASSSSSATLSSSHLSAGGIAGAVIGSLAAVILIVAAVYRYQSRRKRDLRTGAWFSGSKWTLSQRTLPRFLQSDTATIYPSDSVSSRNVPVDPPRSLPYNLPLPPTPAMMEQRQLVHPDHQNRTPMPYPDPHTPSSDIILARGADDHDIHARKPGEYLY